MSDTPLTHDIALERARYLVENRFLVGDPKVLADAMMMSNKKPETQVKDNSPHAELVASVPEMFCIQG